MNTNRKTYIKSKDELTQFERAIINAHPEGLQSAIVEGKRDIGKSMFCYITTTRIFQYLEGLPIDDAYIRALDHFLWTIPQMFKVCDDVLSNTDYKDIMKYDAEHKYRILVSDDVGTHMGKYRFYVDVASVDELKGRIDTIRDVTNGLLMTAPAVSGLLSFLREYPDNRIIKITYDSHGDPKYSRIIEIRDKPKKWARYGRLAFPPIKMSIFVDTWAYAEYKIRKRKAINDLFVRNKDKEKENIVKAFRVIRKIQPNLTDNEIIDKLSLSEEIKNIFKINNEELIDEAKDIS